MTNSTANCHAYVCESVLLSPQNTFAAAFNAGTCICDSTPRFCYYVLIYLFSAPCSVIHIR